MKTIRSLGEILRTIRTAKGLTIDGIAASSGRNRGYLSTIERDRATASSRFLDTVAGPEGYGCPWWDRTRNRDWLVAVRQVFEFGADETDRLSIRGMEVRTALLNAESLLYDLKFAVDRSENLRASINELAERLGLPGVAGMELAKTVPVWAWVIDGYDASKQGPFKDFQDMIDDFAMAASNDEERVWFTQNWVTGRLETLLELDQKRNVGLDEGESTLHRTISEALQDAAMSNEATESILAHVSYWWHREHRSAITTDHHMSARRQMCSSWWG